MTTKNKILEQSANPECKSSLTLSFKLCFLFLFVVILTSLWCAETLSEDLDPINLLESSLSPNSQNVNTSNIPEPSNAPSGIGEPAMQIAKHKSAQREAPVRNTVAVNFADKLNSRSEPDKVPAFAAGQDSLFPSNDKSSKPAPSLQDDLLIANSPTTYLGRQLWQARIGVSKDSNPSQNKTELRQIIRQINSIEFKAQEPSPQPLIAVEPIQEAEPNEISSDAETPQEQEPNTIEHKPPYEQVTDHTLQILKSLSQHPDQLQNPLELAEILFKSRRLKEAAKCYQEALNRMTANETDQLANKAWILFQIGNCLQNDDPPTAMQMYKQLIAEYPDSPWADLAKAKSKLIDWYLKDKPNTLIDGCKL